MAEDGQSSKEKETIDSLSLGRTDRLKPREAIRFILFKTAVTTAHPHNETPAKA
jgi:hypothetical protein